MSRKYMLVAESPTTPVSQTQRKQIAVRIYVDSEGWVQNAGFVFQHIAALENGSIDGPLAIVLHRTVSSTAASALAAFKSGVGTHFVIDKDGTTYQCASLLKKTAHVGPIRSRCHIEGVCTAEELESFKAWGNRMACYRHEKVKDYPTRYPMNEDSVGIETVAMYHASTKTWDAATPEQTSAIYQLVGILKEHYGLSDADIYEHDKIAWKTEGEGADLYYVPDIPIVPPRYPGP